ncbi:MAG TPA: hypothetical protein VGW39_11080 [Chthoniobacterales bacterium]|nr:hypothetical protein [Chthoniobacterales bacterium]
MPKQIISSPESKFWRNYTPERGMSVGELRSKPFTVPVRDLIIPVVGFPSSRFTGVYLESESGGHRFFVGPGATHNEWQPFTVTLPKNLVGSAFHIVAYAQSNSAYLGVGTPYYETNWSLPGVRFSTLFDSTLAAFAYAALLFVPAFVLVRRWQDTDGVRRLLICLVLVGLASLSLFYLAYFNHALGRWAGRCWLLLSLGLLIYLFRSRPSFSQSEWDCLKLIACITAFQALFVFSFHLVSTPYTTNYVFFPAVWSVDNQIPPTLAKLLVKGTADTEWGFGSWTISDRPPLLSSMFYPAAVVLRDLLPGIGSGAEAMIFHVTGFLFQNSWVLVVWAICARAGMNRRESVLTVLLLAFTPFLFLNTTYISPKILGATFCFVQYLFLPTGRREDASGRAAAFDASICGMAAALAIMAHTASGLAALAIFAFGARSTRIKEWWRLGVSGAASACVVVPWIVWSRLYSPSRGPLPKYFLTGDFGFSGPPVSLLDATLQLYRSMSLSTWFQKKLVDLATLGGFELTAVPGALLRHLSWDFHSIRLYQLFFLVPCLGALIVPLLWLLLKRNKLKEAEGAQGGVLWGLVWSSALCFAGQFLVMMAPHFVYHYPYFVILAWHVIAVVAVVKLRVLFLQLAALLSYFCFIIVWIVLVTIKVPVATSLGLICAYAILLAGSVFVVRELLAAIRAKQ